MNKKMRLTLVTGLTVGVLLTIGVQAATTPIKLILNGKSITTKTVGKSTMVDINDVASALGSKVVASGSNRTIPVKLGNAELMRDTTIVYNGSDSVFREDTKLTAPVKFNNKIYAPIDFFEKTGLTPLNYMNDGKKIVLGITGEKLNLTSNVRYSYWGDLYNFSGEKVSKDYIKGEIGNCINKGYQTKDKDELYSIWGDDLHKWSGILLANTHSIDSTGVMGSIVGLDKKYKTVEFDIMVEPTADGIHDLVIKGSTTTDILETIPVSGTSKVVKHIKIDVTGQSELIIDYSNRKNDVKEIGKDGKIVIGDPVAY